MAFSCSVFSWLWLANLEKKQSIWESSLKLSKLIEVKTYSIACAGRLAILNTTPYQFCPHKLSCLTFFTSSLNRRWRKNNQSCLLQYFPSSGSYSSETNIGWTSFTFVKKMRAHMKIQRKEKSKKVKKEQHL